MKQVQAYKWTMFVNQNAHVTERPLTVILVRYVVAVPSGLN